MRRVTSFVVAALLALSLPCNARSQPQSNAALAAPVELLLTGPRLVRRGDKLKFKAVVINRSPQPVAFAFRLGGWDCDGVFRWTITDAGGRLLPTPPPEPVHGMICCLTSAVREDEIIVLQPGEKIEAPQLSDPSDFYAFPRNGFYRVSLRLVFTAAFLDHDEQAGYHYLTPADVAEPKSKLELAVKTGSIDVTSKAWNVYLTD